MKDSLPLVPGPTGSLYIHSGGVLMRLAADLSSASKITSMREELWLTERDEGTPQFPTCQTVFGVCAGSVYRSLVCTNDTEFVLIRRLRISSDLFQSRSGIRAAAPTLWPDIAECRAYRTASHTALLPSYYHEADRDRWDGNVLWLFEDWLWEDCAERKPEDLRVSKHGTWMSFDNWLSSSEVYRAMMLHSAEGYSADYVAKCRSSLRASYEEDCKPGVPWRK